jgi:beta-lactam-binding protein with PASTA domain
VRLPPLTLALAALGIAAAAAAAAWYATLPPRHRTTELTLPRVLGLPQREAVRRLTHEGLRVRVREPRGLGGVGVVVGQAPPAGTTVGRGATVTLRVARR